MSVYNASARIVALVEATSPTEAQERLHAAINAAGFTLYVDHPDSLGAFLSEDQSEAPDIGAPA